VYRVVRVEIARTPTPRRGTRVAVLGGTRTTGGVLRRSHPGSHSRKSGRRVSGTPPIRFHDFAGTFPLPTSGGWNLPLCRHIPTTLGWTPPRAPQAPPRNPAPGASPVFMHFLAAGAKKYPQLHHHQIQSYHIPEPRNLTTTTYILVLHALHAATRVSVIHACVRASHRPLHPSTQHLVHFALTSSHSSASGNRPQTPWRPSRANRREQHGRSSRRAAVRARPRATGYPACRRVRRPSTRDSR
jgi:hypothetical protein